MKPFSSQKISKHPQTLEKQELATTDENFHIAGDATSEKPTPRLPISDPPIAPIERTAAYNVMIDKLHMSDN